MEQILKKATLLAMKLHDGQVDQAGKPYILHSVRVASSLTGTEARILAVLHDVLGDCEITPQQLVGGGIPEHLVKRLVVLTKREDENYFDYIKRVKEDELTRQVKLADLKDNMDLSRLYSTLDGSRVEEVGYLESIVSKVDLDRYRKYQKAVELLNH